MLERINDWTSFAFARIEQFWPAVTLILIKTRCLTEHAPFQSRRNEVMLL